QGNAPESEVVVGFRSVGPVVRQARHEVATHQDVIARTARHGIAPLASHQHVVAEAALQEVVAAITPDHIVTRATLDDAIAPAPGDFRRQRADPIDKTVAGQAVYDNVACNGGGWESRSMSIDSYAVGATGRVDGDGVGTRRAGNNQVAPGGVVG